MSKVTYLNSHLEKFRKEPEIRIDLEDVEALANYYFDENYLRSVSLVAE